LQNGIKEKIVMSIVRTLSKTHRYNCGILSCVFALVVMVLLSASVSCSPANQIVTPVASQATSASPRSTQVPTVTRTPSLIPTTTPSLTPTMGAIVLPTPPVKGVSLALTPDLDQTGYVGNN
jgi:hypothetical protein